MSMVFTNPTYMTPARGTLLEQPVQLWNYLELRDRIKGAGKSDNEEAIEEMKSKLNSWAGIQE